MRWEPTLFLSIAAVFSQVSAADTLYCPKNHNYIEVGMSEAKVIEACGQPIQKRPSNEPVSTKVPVTQLIYNNMGTDTAFYGVWEIQVGSGGGRVEVDIINDKVASVRMNGTSLNSFSVCDNQSIEIGQPASAVYNACGSPSIVNKTFVNKIIPGDHKKEIWTYQYDQYSPSVNLTFVNGVLRSIEK